VRSIWPERAERRNGVMGGSHRQRTRLAAGILLAVAAVIAIVVLAIRASSDGKAVAERNADASRTATTPARGAYFGARVRPSRYTQDATIAAVHRLQREIGRRLDIVHVYLKWHQPFANKSDRAFLRQGSTLLLSWSGADTRAIAAGAYDSWIRRQAAEIRATHKKIFLEWRWEMDRPGLSAQIHSAADYIAAWDHIRAIFTRQHVDNVAWVWCPTGRGFVPDHAAGYYPGNNEVDWICADVYPGPGPYRSFASVAQPFLSWAAHHPKPIMIGEYGVPQTYQPKQRAQWLWGVARTVRSDSQIRAVVYFDGNAHQSYALQPGSPALQAFRRIAREGYFNLGRLPLVGS
jgi:hypothetical protein